MAPPRPGWGSHPDIRSVGLLVALGVVPTAVAYTCYFRGLRTASAALGVLMALLEPLTAAVLAALLLGDRLGGVGVTGAVLLAAAVAMAGQGSGELHHGSPDGAECRRRSSCRSRAMHSARPRTWPST